MNSICGGGAGVEFEVACCAERRRYGKWNPTSFTRIFHNRKSMIRPIARIRRRRILMSRDLVRVEGGQERRRCAEVEGWECGVCHPR